MVSLLRRRVSALPPLHLPRSCFPRQDPPTPFVLGSGPSPESEPGLAGPAATHSPRLLKAHGQQASPRCPPLPEHILI